MAHGFAFFDTPIGCCGIAWSADGVAWLQLPMADIGAMRARILKAFPDAREAAPSHLARTAIHAIGRLLGGEKTTLGEIVLDESGVPAFHRRVYAVTRAIAPGETLTYGEIAQRVGEPGAARAVGQAMGANPWPIIVPCHRVLAANGRPGGFSAHGGLATKERLLAIEGVTLNKAPSFFDWDPALASRPAAKRALG